MLIKGNQLNERQRAMVLAAFPYRWTNDNPRREEFWRAANSRPTLPLVSDDQWLAEHAFHFTVSGEKLLRRKYCEPAYMADPET